MSGMFQDFPYLQSETLIIKKMMEDDLNALNEITSNDNVYRYFAFSIQKKSWLSAHTFYLGLTVTEKYK